MKDSDYKDIYLEIRKKLGEAQVNDPDNYHPIDILAWTSVDLLKNKDVDEKMKLEVKASILHALERIETENMEILYRQKLEARRLQIAREIKNINMEKEAFEALLKKGSKAGIYLKAKYILEDLPFDEPLNEYYLKKCQDGIDYLMESDRKYTLDGPCLYLLMRILWMRKSRHPIFLGERQTLPFAEEDWNEILKLALRLTDMGEEFVTAPLLYLKGVTMFHLRYFEESFSTFRELRNIEAYGRRRVIKSHIMSNPKGQPVKFNGTVERIAPDGSKGDIWVEEIRRSINFFPREFHRKNITVSETINDFHIAFNFFGPNADPPRRIGKK